jgi:Undecaprenyl-phosphate glucose phosphotransferase
MLDTIFVPERSTSGAVDTERRSVLSIPAVALGMVVAGLDAFCVIVTLVMAEGANRAFGAGSSAWLDRALQLGTIAAAVFVVLSLSWGRYSEQAMVGGRRPFVNFLEAWLASFFLIGWFGFLTKTTGDFSRLAVSLGFLLGFLTVFAPHRFILNAVRRRVQSARIVLRTAFVLDADGAGSRELFGQELARQGVLVVGHAKADAAALRDGNAAAWHGALEACRSAFARRRFDAVYLFLPWDELRHVEDMSTLFARLPVPVFLFPDRHVCRVVQGRRLGTGNMTAFEVQRAPLSWVERLQKRAVDLVLATFLLVLLSPLFALVALTILVRDGRPIFFRQHRNGFGGRPFSILKFRTMVVCEDGADIRQAERGDRRLTSFGKVLRRSSLDELPQLINVIRGEMSLIGPRPHALAHDSYYDRLISTYADRQHVAPGITGWAQVNGCRGETRQVADMARRVEHDLWYISHWSLMLDLRILARTALQIFDDNQAF